MPADIFVQIYTHLHIHLSLSHTHTRLQARGASVLGQRIKPTPEMPASHLGPGSSPGHFTSNPALC